MAIDKKIPIYDIAKKLNISPVTVSWGLKDHPALIGALSMEAGETAADTIVEIKPIPNDGFVAKNNCTVGCMKSIKRQGLPIPGDIAFAPSITTPCHLWLSPT